MEKNMSAIANLNDYRPLPEVTTLTYGEDIELRAINADGEVMLCLADLARGLGIQNASDIRKRLPQGVDRIYPLATPGGVQQTTFVTEAGANMVIWRSDKPEARAYAKWCADRIVELRKHGMTATPQTLEDMINDPDLVISLAKALKDERAAKEVAQAQVIELKPKADRWEAFLDADGYISLGEAAKALANTGVKIGGRAIGRNRMMEVLRDAGHLTKRNEASQARVEAGHFVVITSTYIDPAGASHVTSTTKVTPKGLDWLSSFFEKKERRCA